MSEIRLFKVLVVVSWCILVYFVVSEQSYFGVPVEAGMVVLSVVGGLIFFVTYKNKRK